MWPGRSDLQWHRQCVPDQSESGMSMLMEDEKTSVWHHSHPTWPGRQGYRTHHTPPGDNDLTTIAAWFWRQLNCSSEGSCLALQRHGRQDILWDVAPPGQVTPCQQEKAFIFYHLWKPTRLNFHTSTKIQSLWWNGGPHQLKETNPMYLWCRHLVP